VPFNLDKIFQHSRNGAPFHRLPLSPLRSAHHHIDLAASTPRTDESLPPLEDDGIGTVAACKLCGIRLDLMDDQRDTGSRRAAERHRPAGLGFHRASDLSGIRGSADPGFGRATWGLFNKPLGLAAPRPMLVARYRDFGKRPEHQECQEPSRESQATQQHQRGQVQHEKHRV
jgi:hypothetical protein